MRWSLLRWELYPTGRSDFCTVTTEITLCRAVKSQPSKTDDRHVHSLLFIHSLLVSPFRLPLMDELATDINFSFVYFEHRDCSCCSSSDAKFTNAFESTIRLRLGAEAATRMTCDDRYSDLKNSLEKSWWPSGGFRGLVMMLLEYEH